MKINKKNIVSKVIVFLCLLVFSCNLDEFPNEGPDLTVIKSNKYWKCEECAPEYYKNFCAFNNEMDKLTVTIKNIGISTSDTSFTSVAFEDSLGGSRVYLGGNNIVTPPIESGQSIVLEFSYEKEYKCFNPKCELLIVVDADDDVLELDETNNFILASCN